MVSEHVDGFAGLTTCLAPDRPCIAPLKWHVLPYQQAGLVGGVVQLGAAYVAEDAHHVQAGLFRHGDVRVDFLGAGVRECELRRPQA